MMDYELFREVVKETFLSYMPWQYQDMEARVSTVEKVNRRLDGLSLVGADGGGAPSPTLYVSDMYREYLETGDLQAAIQDAADAMDRAFTQAKQLSMDIGTARESIIFQLVNTAQNVEMLKNMPHREFQDPMSLS